jgi:hypothetical protein
VRSWGRLGTTWVEVSTDTNGFNDYVYITTLIQCLLLNLNEDPFHADHGIPAQQSVLTQIFPDYYTYATQSQFRQFFASLSVQKIKSRTPTYNIQALTHSGVIIQETIAT